MNDHWAMFLSAHCIHQGNIFITSKHTACITDIGIHTLMNQVTWDLEGRVRIPQAWPYKAREELNANGVINGLIQPTEAMDVYSWAATVFTVGTFHCMFDGP
jgi:hypothetical protein